MATSVERSLRRSTNSAANERRQPVAVTERAPQRLGHMTEAASQEFWDKIDAFAASLNHAEQAAFAELVASDDVAGFSAGWPGINTMVTPNLTAQVDAILQGRGSASSVASTADGNPDGFASSAGGSPNV